LRSESVDRRGAFVYWWRLEVSVLVENETVLLDKAELKLLAAVASKDEERPNVNCIGIRCDGREAIVHATDGCRIVRCKVDADGPGVNMTVPRPIIVAAIALSTPTASVRFFRDTRDRFEVDEKVLTWPGHAAEAIYAEDLFDLPPIATKRMPLLAMGACYLSDAKMLAAACGTTDDTIRLHAPPDHLSALHLLCGPWHYVVMPRNSDDTEQAAKQLGLFKEPEKVDAPPESE
jgi:hypothetical protein